MVDYEERRELLTKELKGMKEKGYLVFINTPDKGNCYNYGIISDGKNIVYTQFAAFGFGFTTTFLYVPSKSNGSGIRTSDDFGYRHLNETVFDEATKYGLGYAHRYHAQLYKSLEDYLERPLNTGYYVEL